MTSTRQKPEPDTDAPEAGVFMDPRIRLLRMIVIGMGVVLVVGLLVVIVRIVQLTSRVQSDTPAAATLVKGDVRLPLPAGATVQHVSMAGTRLVVHYDAPAGAAIVILELATGAVVSRIAIVPEGR
jgi:hypothetical protein